MAGKGGGDGNDLHSCARLFTTIYSIIIIVLGLGCLAVGIWMLADDDVKAYLFVFGARPDNNWLIVVVGLFITCGIIVVGTGVLGFIAVRKQSVFYLKIFAALLFCMMVTQLISGFLIVAFRERIYISVKDNMLLQITEEYVFDNDIGHAWNRVQVKNRCCGVDGSWDYRCSMYWHSQNSGIICPDYYYMGTKHVPNTCCKLEFNQDRDLRWVDPQKPQPKSEKYCQQHAEGNMDGSDYLNGRGCFSALTDFIYTHIDILLGISIGMGILEIIGLVAAFVVMKSLKDDEL